MSIPDYAVLVTVGTVAFLHFPMRYLVRWHPSIGIIPAKGSRKWRRITAQIQKKVERETSMKFLPPKRGS